MYEYNTTKAMDALLTVYESRNVITRVPWTSKHFPGCCTRRQSVVCVRLIMSVFALQGLLTRSPNRREKASRTSVIHPLAMKSLLKRALGCACRDLPWITAPSSSDHGRIGCCSSILMSTYTSEGKWDSRCCQNYSVQVWLDAAM